MELPLVPACFRNDSWSLPGFFNCSASSFAVLRLCYRLHALVTACCARVMGLCAGPNKSAGAPGGRSRCKLVDGDGGPLGPEVMACGGPWGGWGILTGGCQGNGRGSPRGIDKAGTRGKLEGRGPGRGRLKEGMRRGI